jgi:hypothetical protein
MRAQNPCYRLKFTAVGIAGLVLLFDVDKKEAYLIPKSLGLFEMTLEKVKKAINQIPYDKDY